MGRRLRSGFPKQGIWFVTTTVSEFRPIFSNQTLALAALKEMDRYTAQHKVRLYEYSIMPSHIHMLLEITDEGGALSSFMRDLKRSIAYECRGSWNGESGLWMDRFDDLLITEEETLRIKIEYIRNNPVKAHLSAEPEGYRYSSAWTRLQGDDVLYRLHDWGSFLGS